MFKTISKKHLLILTLLFASQVQAQQWCTTTVSNLLLRSEGSVLVKVIARGDYLQFCNINTDWKGVSPTTCAAWLTLVRSAVARKSSMLFYYSQPTPCDQITTYESAPAPSFVMMSD
jgi:hypothetical protein